MKKAKNVAEFFDIIKKDGCVSFDAVRSYGDKAYTNEHKVYLLYKDGQKEKGFGTILAERTYGTGGPFGENIGVADMKKGILYVYSFTLGGEESKLLGGYNGSLKDITRLTHAFNEAVEDEIYKLIDQMEEERLSEYCTVFDQNLSLASIRAEADKDVKKILLSEDPKRALDFPDYTEDVKTPEHYTVWEYALENRLSAGDIAEMVFAEEYDEELQAYKGRQRYHYIYWYFLKRAYENWQERPDAKELTVLKNLMKAMSGTKNLKVTFADGSQESIETHRIESAVVNDYRIYRKDSDSSSFKDVVEITYAKKVLYRKGGEETDV